LDGPQGLPERLDGPQGLLGPQGFAFRVCLLGPQGEPDFFSWAMAPGAAMPAESANASAATRFETDFI